MNNVSTVQLDEFIASCQQRVESVLVSELEQAAPSKELQEAMAYACLGSGKRIRPVLVYGAAKALGGELDNADAAAAAVELIHSYSLVHDDLPAMDDDDLRRGKPSVHKAFSEATAILVGDGLQSLAFSVLSKEPSGLTTAARLRQVQCLSLAIGNFGMVAGQALDFAATGLQASLSQLESLHKLKTGALIRASVELGAHSVEGCSDDQIQKLSTYAECIGLAFQVRDDILDVTAETSVLGKPQGSDQLNNKPTYVSLLGLEQAQAKASSLIEEAVSALDGFPSNADALRDLAAFIVNRSH